MTRKHYKLLAQAFFKLRCDAELGLMTADQAINHIEDEVCIILNNDNPEFSYQKFTDASGRRD